MYEVTATVESGDTLRRDASIEMSQKVDGAITVIDSHRE